MNRASLWILGAALLAAGCAHTVKVPLRPAFDGGVAESAVLASIRPALVVQPGRFTDSRGDTSKLAMFKQGVHTFNLYGERPMGDVLFEGLAVVFSRAGHTLGGSAEPQLRVDITLLSVQAARNAGMVAVGASSAVQIKLDFEDVRAGRPVYSGIYNGTDKRSRAMVGTMGMVNASIDQSILNCLNEVGKDDRLATTLRTLSSAP